MRHINVRFLALVLTFSPLAHASGPADSYGFQAKTKQVSTAESFWSSFWDLLRGKRVAQADLTVKVTDAAGAPLAGAAVLVGQRRGEPFAGNYVLTDADGVARFSDPSLSGSKLPVTASLEGYGTFTLLDNAANHVEIALAPHPREGEHAFLQGKVTGFPTGYNRRTLEMGFFLPAFRPESLLNFDPQQIVSSYKVEIDVYGKRMVPGNIVLPPQDKSYGIFPVHLEKPEFIMPLARGFESHMAALAGTVPISDAIGAIRNKDFLGVLNMATLTHVAWRERMVVRGDERFDMHLDQPLSQGAVTSQLSGVGQKLDAISLSVVDPEGDRGDFIPLDVKSLKSESIRNGSGALKLGIMNQRKATDRYYVFTGLFDRNQLIPDDGKKREIRTRAIVGAIEEVDPASLTARFSGFFRTMQSQGVASANREYRFTPAANASAGLSPDFVLLNVVSEKKNAATQGTTRTVLWSTVAQGGAERIVLPDLGAPVLPNPDASKEERFVWEVIAFKSRAAANEGGLDVQSALRNVQHVSTLVEKF